MAKVNKDNGFHIVTLSVLSNKVPSASFINNTVLADEEVIADVIFTFL